MVDAKKTIIIESDYPEGFFEWLKVNKPIWKAFSRRAFQMAVRRERYSARTIVEVLRFHTDLRENDPKFKLSNNMTPGLARYWMAKYGHLHPGFFSLHERGPAQSRLF